MSTLPDETEWLATLGTAPSNPELLQFLEAGFRLGREARVLVLAARDSSAKPWQAVFGRIDLARPGDPAAGAIRPRGNVIVLEERPSGGSLLTRVQSAMDGGPLVVADIPFAEHAMNSGWGSHRGHENGLDYGTGWPSIVIATNSQIRSPYIDGAIEADGPTPVFMGLERLAWAVSGFRRTPGSGIDVRPRRFQFLAWDYRGRIDQFRSTGRKLFIGVKPPNDPNLRLVALAGGDTTEVPLMKTGPAREQLALDEDILRARATLKYGEDVVVEHALDIPRDLALAQLQGSPRLSSQFGDIATEATLPPRPSASTTHGWMIGKQLGVGAQGVASLAYQSEPFPRVGVIKVLHPRPSQAPGQRTKALARFQREIDVMRSFDHPFLLKVLDAEIDTDSPWIVSEYMPFGSLQQHLAVYRGDVWRSLRLARDVAVALERLHDSKLVHRDVKPSNILLRGLDHAVLGDFGIVHDSAETSLTSTDEKVASKWYGPPEAEDGRLDDPPANFDLYSLGKVIYAMLSGGGRFQREDFRAPKADLKLLLRRTDLEPVNILLDKLVTLRPEDRFESARHVVEAIDRVLSAMFGRRDGRDRCAACGEATTVDRGRLQVDSGGFKAGGAPIDVHARVCPNCGAIDLADRAPSKRT